MKNIVLIGMPGCGKTTVGKSLAKMLNREFVDMDLYLENSQNMSILDMCNTYGKDYFRKTESDLVKEISLLNDLIISTGGGVILNPENIKNLRKNGVIIFIDRTPSQIIDTGINVKTRPFLKDTQSLYKLYEDRLPLYNKYAQFKISCNTRQKALEELITIINFIHKPHRFYVIGKPLKHSLSPQIHNLILNSIFDSVSYGLKEIEQNDLKKWTTHVRKSNIKGFNVTMPYKQEIIKYLDEIDESAKLYGCVNTVVCKSEKLIGYNTDVDGFFESLDDIEFIPQNKNIVILGSGSVAKAIVKGFSTKRNNKITILSRDVKKAKQNIDNDDVIYDNFEINNIKNYCKNAELLMNCTPLGMKGIRDDYQDLSFMSNLSKKSIVVDLIYNPSKTKFLKSAQDNNLKTINGLGMLIYQAIIADEYYIDTIFNRKEMYNLIFKKLYEDEKYGNK